MHERLLDTLPRFTVRSGFFGRITLPIKTGRGKRKRPGFTA